MPSSDTTSQQSLTVALRVRPINMMEVGQGARYIAHVVDKQLVVLQDPSDTTDDILRQNRSRQKEYLFDCALGPQTSQVEVYEATTRCLIDSVLTGYNATVFAYGPTGTGKTYTMLGTDAEPGIMVLTLNDLFKRMEEDQHVMKYRATIAYLEVYNEMICDLLQPSSGFLELREDSKGNVVVAGLFEKETSSTTEVMQLLRVGNERRSCEPTAVNMTSSRSHAVLQVTVEASRLAAGAQQEVQTGRLYMVDLAGSERAAQTQNRGRRMVEGAHINRSLLALGNCINALVGNNKNHYVNYRDSKLTRLLKEALGGNCRTVMIAHVSPASTSFEESRNTLGYADRAKHIKTKIRQNTTDVDYHILQYTAVIADLQQEIARLRSKCIESSGSILHTGITDGHADNRSVMEFAQISGELKDVLKKQASLRQELQSKDDLLLQNSADIQRHKSFELEPRPESRNTGSHYSLSDAIAITASSTEVTLLSTNQGKPHNSFSSPLEPYKLQDDNLGGIVSPDGATMTMLSMPGASGWCGEEALKELSLLYREREQLQEQQKSIVDRLEQAQSKAVDLKDRLAEYISTDSQHDIFSYLTKINELESDNIHQVRSMSHVRNGMLHVRHMLEQLVQQNRQCMKLVERQRSLIKGHFSDCLLSVEEQYKQLVEQQQLLSIRLSSSHLQLHPLFDSKHNGNITDGEIIKARLLEADSQCGEESTPQLPILPGVTTSENSSKVLKKMDTVTSLPSLEAKTSQSDDMIRSHSELCLQNSSGGNKVKSTALPKISKDARKPQQQPKHSTSTSHSYTLAPVRPSNGKGLSTKPFVFTPPVPSYSASQQSDNSNFHPHNKTYVSISKNSGRAHFEVKKGVAMDTKVPSSMRKKLLNQNTRRYAMNMADTSVTISKPIEPHHRRKAAAKREPIKKIPLPIKEVKDFSIVTSNLVASQKPQPITPPDVSHPTKLPRAIPNGATQPPRASGKPLSVTGTGISTNKT